MSFICLWVFLQVIVSIPDYLSVTSTKKKVLFTNLLLVTIVLGVMYTKDIDKKVSVDFLIPSNHNSIYHNPSFEKEYRGLLRYLEHPLYMHWTLRTVQGRAKSLGFSEKGNTRWKVGVTKKTQEICSKKKWDLRPCKKSGKDFTKGGSKVKRLRLCRIPRFSLQEGGSSKWPKIRVGQGYLIWGSSQYLEVSPTSDSGHKHLYWCRLYLWTNTKRTHEWQIKLT